jgi:hypothetical protein
VDYDLLIYQAVIPFRMINIYMVYQFRHHALRHLLRVGVPANGIKEHISGQQLPGVLFEFCLENLNPSGYLALFPFIIC